MPIQPPFRPLAYPKLQSWPQGSKLAPAPELVVKAVRSKLWEIPAHFHCSIIGTCLTTGEARRFCSRAGDKEAANASDHDLHAIMVRTASNGDAVGKQLGKFLDAKHERFVRKFNALTDASALREAWAAAVVEGDIPGAYWAVLTHAHVDRQLARDAFGEVHMLSHLVGRSNRLDLARLRQLETALEDRDQRMALQEARLQEAAREKQALLKEIGTVRDELAEERRRRPVRAAVGEAPDRIEPLKRQLAQARRHIAETDARLENVVAANANLLSQRIEMEQQVAAMQREISALELLLDIDAKEGPTPPMLHGRTLLYVGGRPGLIERLTQIASRMGCELIAHDGGIEDGLALLPGNVSRADTVLFPVDCVSHSAMLSVKKLCRASGKPFVPLASASIASFLAAAAELRGAIQQGTVQ